MILLALSILAALVIAPTAFLYCFTARAMLERGTLPADFKLIAYFWLVLGYPADVVFNVVRGTIRFKEPPRELLYTSRVQRHIDHSNGWRLKEAIDSAVWLNDVDPNHIKRVPEAIARASRQA